MKIILKFIIVLATICIHLEQSNGLKLDCQLEKVTKEVLKKEKYDPKKISETLCLAFGYKKPAKNGIFSSSTPTEKNEKKELEGCQAIFLPYLNEIKVLEKDAENFGKYCTGHKLNMEKSLHMLNVLKPFCWSMSELAKLPIVPEYESLRITPKDWFNLQFGSMQLQKCLKEIGSDKHDEKISNNKIDILEAYKNFNLQGYSRCTCVEVIGLRNVYDKLNKNNEYNSLKSFYNDICINHRHYTLNVIRDGCTKQQLEAISNYNLDEAKSLGIDLRMLVKFITSADMVFSSGWKSGSEKSKDWPLSYMIKNSYKDGQFTMSTIDIMAIAMSNGYSAEDYDKFVKVALEQEISGLIGSPYCIQKLIDIFKFRTYKEDPEVLKLFISYKYNDIENAKKTPARLLQSLLDVTEPDTGCLPFTDKVSVITDLFYKNEMEADHFYELLSLGKMADKTLDEILDCLRVSLYVDEMIEKDEHLICRPQNADEEGYKLFKFQLKKIFNKRLFRNEDNHKRCEKFLSDSRKRDKILELFKDLFKVDKHVNTLNDIFDYESKFDDVPLT